VLEAASRSGSRRIAMADWVSGIMTHSLQPGELLTAIELRPWPQGHGYAFEEFARRHGDFAITAVGCLIELAPNGTIAQAALCVSGLGPAPVRVAAAERLLEGESPSH
jgi:carbon-monoxide dehydrogenase medium subunit